MRPLTAVFALVLALTSPLFADEAVDRLIQRGDRFHESRGRGEKWCVKALEAYEKALAIDPENVEASWKFARMSCWLGSHSSDKESGLEVFKKGIELAKRAIALDESSVESHYWLGACYGRYAELKGVLDSLALVEPLKKEFRRVVELDEKYEAGGGHRSLGFLAFKLPSFAGGSNERAIELLKKAIEINEKHLLNHLFIAEVYLDEGDDELAKKHLLAVIDGEYEEGRRPDNDEQKLRAKELLEELETE